MTVPLLIAVDAPVTAGDAALSYLSSSPLPPGTAVLAPLGPRIVAGYVLGAEPQHVAVRLRPIIAALPEIPLLPADLLALARSLARQYLCSVGEALAAMLPGGLMRNLRVRAVPGKTAAGGRAQRAIRRRPVPPDGLRKAVGTGAAALLTEWVAAGALQLEAVLPPPAPPAAVPSRRLRLRLHPALWPPQEQGPRRLLFMGPEREGTYLAAVADAARRAVPALAIFASVDAAERFAVRVREVLALSVTVLHGELDDETRTARWLAVRAAGGIISGTRAAVFAPLPGAGLVIVDEEGDVGHQEERVPRYHAADVARGRAAAWSAALIVADEVPRVETFALTETGDLLLRRPAHTLPRPKVVIVDLRRPRGASVEARPSERAGPPVLAPPVVEAVGRVLRDGGRAAIFVHRKGYADLLVCGECGYSQRCARCDVTLAYDLRERVLRCRYCHDRFAAPASCPRCGGRTLIPRGAGTQRVARLAATLWRVPIHRLDADIAPTAAKAAALLLQFQREGGILVATPLLLGMEQPRVDLVVIALADASLRHPDYRAPERGLRTLWRVRAVARSWCYVQTFAPDHPALVALRRGDLAPFYRDELTLRRAFQYPPYGEVLSLEVTGTEERAREAAASIADAAGEGPEVLGPAPLRKGRRSRWQVILRGTHPIARDALVSRLRRPPRGVRVSVDVNP